MARIDAFLDLVQQQGASDLHVSAGAPPIVRLHGELRPVPHEPLTAELTEFLLFEIMDEATRARFEEARDVDFSYEVQGVVRVRCNVYEQSRGIAGAFRILPREILDLATLGLPDSVARLAELPRGLVVVTGPPGTGKSTTMAALIDHINRNHRRHILTLEDPIEYKHPNQMSLVTQREVGRHTPTFVQALRSALRADPDVIMVGEMRDPDTMALALTAAATGQLVFGTLHTMSAAQTIDRILDSFDGERQAQVRLMLAESLKGVLAQRLIRTADGKGRALALEILTGTQAVSALIREKKTFQLPSIIQTGKKDGMQTMDEGILQLVRAGRVSTEDAAPHVSSREMLMGNVRQVSHNQAENLRAA
jgi:twitching motility protein PilT